MDEALATLADAPPAPENAHIVTKNLDNNTTLEWTAANAPSGTKYEIVWREITAPDWQFSTDKGITQPAAPDGAYSVTLPISKDNVIFGVRSTDAQGHRSPAEVPMPER